MTALTIDLQINPGTNEWPRLRDAALEAEAAGYAALWSFDHFDGAVLGGDRPMLECFTLLGALAAATTSIALGTLVVNVANRHPAVTAAAAISAQRISGGRLLLGIGAGASPNSPWAAEHRDRSITLKPTMAERHLALAEQIDAIDTAYAELGRSAATPVPRLPIHVGTNSIELSRLAGERADGLNVRMTHPRAAEFLRAARDAAGDRAFVTSGWAFVADGVDAARAQAEAMQLDRLVLVELGAIERLPAL